MKRKLNDRLHAFFAITGEECGDNLSSRSFWLEKLLQAGVTHPLCGCMEIPTL